MEGCHNRCQPPLAVRTLEVEEPEEARTLEVEAPSSAVVLGLLWVLMAAAEVVVELQEALGAEVALAEGVSVVRVGLALWSLEESKAAEGGTVVSASARIVRAVFFALETPVEPLAKVLDALESGAIVQPLAAA